METRNPSPYARFLSAGVPCLIFLASLQYLLSGMNPTFYMDDSPETVSSCFHWGIAHPPGYPLLSTLGRIFVLLPIGHIPIRVNLMVAVFAAATVAILYVLVRQAFRTPAFPALLLVLAWIAGGASYTNALSAKGGVYHLGSLLLTLTLWAVVKRRLDAALFFMGLSLSNHWMSALATLPGVLWLSWPTARNDRRRWRAWAPGLAAGLSALSLLLVLPFRALFHPSPNYGDPSSWTRLLPHLLLEQFQGIRTLDVWREGWPQAVAWFTAVLRDLPVALPLALAGLILGWRADRHRAIGFGLVWAIPAAVVNYGFPLSGRRFEFNFATQLFPSCLPVLLFAAWALTAWMSSRPESRAFRSRLLAIPLLAAGLLVGARFTSAFHATYTFVYDFGLNALQAVPRGGALFARGDAVDFGLWYLQWVDGKRPDVVVTTVENLPTPWYRERLRRDHPGLEPPEPTGALPSNPFPGFVRPWAQALRARGLFFTYNQLQIDGLGDAALTPRGLLQQAHLPPEIPAFRVGSAGRFWDSMRLRRIMDPEADDLTRRYLLKDYAVARSLLGMRRYAEAQSKADRGNAPKEAREGLREAHRDFAWAHQVAPDEKGYAFNAGLALSNAGDWSAAVPWFEKAARIDPAYPEAYYNAALAALKAEDFQKAGMHLEAVLRLRPNLQDAKDRLAELMKKGRYRIR